MKFTVKLVVTMLIIGLGQAHTVTRYNYGAHARLDAGYFSEKVEGTDVVQNGYLMDKYRKIIEV